MTKTITITEDQLWEIDVAVRYAQCYLRKLRQWKEGKIELAVEGCDPPHCPDDDVLKDEMDRMITLKNEMDDLYECDT
jgi:hypothetical protein